MSTSKRSTLSKSLRSSAGGVGVALPAVPPSPHGSGGRAVSPRPTISHARSGSPPAGLGRATTLSPFPRHSDDSPLASDSPPPGAAADGSGSGGGGGGGGGDGTFRSSHRKGALDTNLKAAPVSRQADIMRKVQELVARNKLIVETANGTASAAATAAAAAAAAAAVGADSPLAAASLAPLFAPPPPLSTPAKAPLPIGRVQSIVRTTAPPADVSPAQHAVRTHALAASASAPGLTAPPPPAPPPAILDPISLDALLAKSRLNHSKQTIAKKRAAEQHAAERRRAAEAARLQQQLLHQQMLQNQQLMQLDSAHHVLSQIAIPNSAASVAAVQPPPSQSPARRAIAGARAAAAEANAVARPAKSKAAKPTAGGGIAPLPATTTPKPHQRHTAFGSVEDDEPAAAIDNSDPLSNRSGGGSKSARGTSSSPSPRRVLRPSDEEKRIESVAAPAAGAPPGLMKRPSVTFAARPSLLTSAAAAASLPSVVPISTLLANATPTPTLTAQSLAKLFSDPSGSGGAGAGSHHTSYMTASAQHAAQAQAALIAHVTEQMIFPASAITEPPPPPPPPQEKTTAAARPSLSGISPALMAATLAGAITGAAGQHGRRPSSTTGGGGKRPSLLQRMGSVTSVAGSGGASGPAPIPPVWGPHSTLPIPATRIPNDDRVPLDAEHLPLNALDSLNPIHFTFPLPVPVSRKETSLLDNWLTKRFHRLVTSPIPGSITAVAAALNDTPTRKTPDQFTLTDVQELLWIQRTALFELSRQTAAQGTVSAPPTDTATAHGHGGHGAGAGHHHRPSLHASAAAAAALTHDPSAPTAAQLHARERAAIGFRLTASMEHTHEFILKALTAAAVARESEKEKEHKRLNEVDHRHDELVERQREEKERWTQEKLKLESQCSLLEHELERMKMQLELSAGNHTGGAPSSGGVVLHTPLTRVLAAGANAASGSGANASGAVPESGDGGVDSRPTSASMAAAVATAVATSGTAAPATAPATTLTVSGRPTTSGGGLSTLPEDGVIGQPLATAPPARSSTAPASVSRPLSAHSHDSSDYHPIDDPVALAAAATVQDEARASLLTGVDSSHAHLMALVQTMQPRTAAAGNGAAGGSGAAGGGGGHAKSRAAGSMAAADDETDSLDGGQPLPHDDASYQEELMHQQSLAVEARNETLYQTVSKLEAKYAEYQDAEKELELNLREKLDFEFRIRELNKTLERHKQLLNYKALESLLTENHRLLAKIKELRDDKRIVNRVLAQAGQATAAKPLKRRRRKVRKGSISPSPKSRNSPNGGSNGSTKRRPSIDAELNPSDLDDPDGDEFEDDDTAADGEEKDIQPVTEEADDEPAETGDGTSFKAGAIMKRKDPSSVLPPAPAAFSVSITNAQPSKIKPVLRRTRSLPCVSAGLFSESGVFGFGEGTILLLANKKAKIHPSKLRQTRSFHDFSYYRFHGSASKTAVESSWEVALNQHTTQELQGKIIDIGTAIYKENSVFEISPAASRLSCLQVLEMDRVYYERRLQETALVRKIMLTHKELANSANGAAPDDGRKKQAYLERTIVSQLMGHLMIRNYTLARRVAVAQLGIVTAVKDDADRALLTHAFARQSDAVSALVWCDVLGGMKNLAMHKALDWLARQKLPLLDGSQDPKFASQVKALSETYNPSIHKEPLWSRDVLKTTAALYIGDFASVFTTQPEPDLTSVQAPGWIRAFILQMYTRKLLLDRDDDLAWRTRSPLSEVVYDYALQSHGPLRSSAERYLMSVITNVHTHQLQPQVWVFGKFVGMFGGYPPAYVDFYLYVVSCLQMRSSRYECVLQPEFNQKLDRVTADEVINDICPASGTSAAHRNFMSAGVAQLFSIKTVNPDGSTTTTEHTHVDVDEFLALTVNRYDQLVREMCDNLRSAILVNEHRKANGIPNTPNHSESGGGITISSVLFPTGAPTAIASAGAADVLKQRRDQSLRQAAQSGNLPTPRGRHATPQSNALTQPAANGGGTTITTTSPDAKTSVLLSPGADGRRSSIPVLPMTTLTAPTAIQPSPRSSLVAALSEADGAMTGRRTSVIHGTASTASGLPLATGADAATVANHVHTMTTAPSSIVSLIHSTLATEKTAQQHTSKRFSTILSPAGGLLPAAAMTAAANPNAIPGRDDTKHVIASQLVRPPSAGHMHGGGRAAGSTHHPSRIPELSLNEFKVLVLGVVPMTSNASAALANAAAATAGGAADSKALAVVETKKSSPHKLKITTSAATAAASAAAPAIGSALIAPSDSQISRVYRALVRSEWLGAECKPEPFFVLVGELFVWNVKRRLRLRERLRHEDRKGLTS